MISWVKCCVLVKSAYREWLLLRLLVINPTSELHLICSHNVLMKKENTSSFDIRIDSSVNLRLSVLQLPHVARRWFGGWRWVWWGAASRTRDGSVYACTLAGGARVTCATTLAHVSPRAALQGNDSSSSLIHWYICFEVDNVMWCVQYHYSSGSVCSIVQGLVRVVLNTVEAQYHRCKRIPAMLVMYHHTRSRGMWINLYCYIIL